MLLNLGDFGEPVVFAVDGTHVPYQRVQVDVFKIVVLVRHALNI